MIVVLPSALREGPKGMLPSAAWLLFAASTGFGAAWGWQLLAAAKSIPGVEVQPAGYWFVYAMVASLGTMALVWITGVCRVHIASALNHKPTKQWETQEAVREYLLLRDARTRGRQVTGSGGPCMTPKWKAYLAHNARNGQVAADQ